MNINEWYAEKCGVTTLDSGWSIKNSSPFIWYKYERWDIKDPRCMQVVREKFKLRTEPTKDGKWVCYQSNYFTRIICTAHYGDTLPEAEYACCVAIYEAMR